MRIDIKAAQHDREWANMLAYAQDTDAAEAFTGFWLFDHFVPINGHVEGPCLDGSDFAGRVGRRYPACKAGSDGWLQRISLSGGAGQDRHHC